MVFIVLRANNRNVLVGGEFPRNVRLDLVILLDVLHLRSIVTYEVILVHFVRVRHVVVVMHHNVVDGRLRFLYPSQRTRQSLCSCSWKTSCSWSSSFGAIGCIAIVHNHLLVLRLASGT